MLAGETDMLNYHANALADLAETYVAAGRAEDARAHLEQALSRLLQDSPDARNHALLAEVRLDVVDTDAV